MQNPTTPFVDFRPMHHEIREEIFTAIKSVIDSEHYICGPHVTAFENEFADYCGARHAIGVSNGLDALIMILKALEIGPGNEVILPANTFIATALAVSAVGAKPVLVDIQEDTFNIDPKLVEKSLTKNTRAVIGVHLYGQLCDVQSLAALCNSAKIHFIEDAAQAHGAELNKKRAGQFGIAAGFSFYPGKNLGALGDGGAVVSNDPELSSRIRLLRGYGSKQKYHHLVKGGNNRLDEIHAAVLRVKLRRLDQWNEIRRSIAQAYSKSLGRRDQITIPQNRGDDLNHVWHLYVIRSKERSELQRRFSEFGVETLIHYPIPIHLQDAYTDLGYQEGSFEITEALCKEIISLPMWIGLNVDDCIQRINRALR